MVSVAQYAPVVIVYRCGERTTGGEFAVKVPALRGRDGRERGGAAGAHLPRHPHPCRGVQGRRDSIDAGQALPLAYMVSH